jgi:hypothetical protein
MASSNAANGSSTTNGTTDSFQLLTASYSSPFNIPFTFTQKLPNPATSAPTDRVAYLSKLRAATAELQKTINEELTQRMEEDKLRAADVTTEAGRKSDIVDEGKEEENYGEEVMEDDS